MRLIFFERVIRPGRIPEALAAEESEEIINRIFSSEYINYYIEFRSCPQAAKIS